MEPEGSFQCPQESATGSCRESARRESYCTGIPRYTRSHFTRFRYNAI
jgi:hypothetical protein